MCFLYNFRYIALSIDFTQHHRESGLFMCVSIRLEPTQMQGISSFLSIRPLLIPSSFSGLDLHVALMVTHKEHSSFIADSTIQLLNFWIVLQIFLFISALLIMFGELWAVVTEHAQYICQCHHWFQLLLGFLFCATAVLQLRFLSLAAVCVYEVTHTKKKLWSNSFYFCSIILWHIPFRYSPSRKTSSTSMVLPFWQKGLLSVLQSCSFCLF